MTTPIVEMALSRPQRRQGSLDIVSSRKRTTHPRKTTIFEHNHEGLKEYSDVKMPLPLSREELLNRLNTFSPLTWTVMDSQLSPLVCAVQGWKSHDSHNRKNELHCVGCHALLMVKLPDETELIDISDDELGVSIGYGAVENLFNTNHFSDGGDDSSDLMSLTEDISSPSFYKTLIDSYLRRLKSEHYPKCPFIPLLPLKPEDQDYYIKSKDIPREIRAFKERFQILQRNDSLLNEIKFKRIVNLTKSHLNFISNYSSNDNIKPFLISLLGWSLKIQNFSKDTITLLRCDYCCRRILLSSTYKDKGGGGGGVEIEKLPSCPYPVSTSVIEDIEFGEGGINDEPNINDDLFTNEIDLMGEHEDWCCIPNGWSFVLIGLQSL